MNARVIIARHGGEERVVDRWGSGGDGLRIWELRRRPRSSTVVRAIDYLDDEDVYFAEVASRRPFEVDG